MKKMFFLATILAMSTSSVFAANHGHDSMKEHHAEQMVKHQMTVVDTNKDGKITKEEQLSACEKMFNESDKNQDKSVSLDELKAGMEKHFSAMKAEDKKGHHDMHKADGMARYKMSITDANKDGMISAEENKATSEKMFTEADKNKDNVLMKDELKAAMQAHMDKMHAQKKEFHAEQKAAYKLNTMDSNKDGQVSKDEYQAAMEKKFMDADTDKNSVLSKEEIKKQAQSYMSQYKSQQHNHSETN